MLSSTATHNVTSDDRVHVSRKKRMCAMSPRYLYDTQAAQRFLLFFFFFFAKMRENIFEW